jgi:hypothetical protein
MPDDNIYDSRPKGTFTAIMTPPWWVDIATAKNGCVIQVHHPDHGWLAFLLPPEHANKLGVALVGQSALCEYFAGAAAPSTVAVN